MFPFLRKAAARLTLRFSPARARWREHVGVYLPLLVEAFPEDPCAYVLILRTMDDLKARRLPQMRNRLQLLHKMSQRSGRKPDMALAHVLEGLFHLARGDAAAMARSMRRADAAGHTFHLPYMMLAMYYLHDLWSFQRCCEALDKAIDCVYKYPPLDENKRRGVALMQTSMALALTMMHRLDEADRMLQRAVLAEASEEYQHALATLRAVQGRRDEAQMALDALEKLSPQRVKDYGEGIRMMMDGTHPHFTAKTPDQEAIAAYWTWFVAHDRELRRQLNLEGPSACHQLQREAFHSLVPEPANIDMMSHSFVILDGRLEMHFCANHSRTYQALIDALIAACPEEIKTHWTLRGFPGDAYGSPRETVAHYAQQAAEAAPQEEA